MSGWRCFKSITHPTERPLRLSLRPIQTDIQNIHQVDKKTTSVHPLVRKLKLFAVKHSLAF